MTAHTPTTVDECRHGLSLRTYCRLCNDELVAERDALKAEGEEMRRLLMATAERWDDPCKCGGCLPCAIRGFLKGAK